MNSLQHGETNVKHLWLRAHTASERSFARALRTFFGEQAARVAREIADVHGLTPDMLALVFSADAEHQLLLPIVRRSLGVLMVAGAQAEIEASADGAKAADPFDPEYMERFDLSPSDLTQQFIETIPPAIRDRIRYAVDESTRQPYWRAIQDGVQADIGDIIKTSIDDGDSPGQMAKRIREQLGGDDARRRSKVIARSETTMALNAGHNEALQELAGQGDVLGKQWLTIGDDDVRETHAALNGIVVPIKENFAVGLGSAPYPGHWSLPAGERINCRCTQIGAVGG